MADLLLPLHLRQARTSFRYIDSTGSSRATFTGLLRTAAKGGDRWGASIEWTKHGGDSITERSNRAALRAFIASLRGRQNRTYLTDLSYRRRGSMPTGELLTNNTFANGTTGWSAGSEFGIYASDRVLRGVRTAMTAASNIASQNVTVVQYAPYAARSMIIPGRGSFSTVGPLVGAALSFSTYGTPGLLTAVMVGDSGTTASFIIRDNGASGTSAGDYISIPYTSLARCALVDNAPNALLRSDALENASWTATGLSGRFANADTAPDGTATADQIVENSSTSNHGIDQSVARASAAADICSFGYFRSGGTARNVYLTAGNDGADMGSAVFALSGGSAGTIVSGPTNSGAATNSRAFIVPAGNGWYFCCVIARCPAASTLRTYAQIANGTTINYAGNGAAYLLMWRVGAALSSMPTRGGQTTSSALTSGTTQTGSGLYTKGWPASTDGLLLVNDQFEVITSYGSELKTLTASVNSDAAGLAYMQFEPPLRGAPADNAPIILHQPMGRFAYVGESPGWDNDPGFFSSASCELEEA